MLDPDRTLEDTYCRWCGWIYSAHTDTTPSDGAVPRTPCLGSKEHFRPKVEMKEERLPTIARKDCYDDTDRRYLNDPAFAAAVDSLMVMAAQHEFTPGELKQIAFKAALELELRSFKRMTVRVMPEGKG